ncbi:MAG TPA: hypothetical protein VHE30_23850 [Polyangiaceae bacterium]|nr:hypothetical protein [Polyangiaceae bacterium]
MRITGWSFLLAVAALGCSGKVQTGTCGESCGDTGAGGKEPMGNDPGGASGSGGSGNGTGGARNDGAGGLSLPNTGGAVGAGGGVSCTAILTDTEPPPTDVLVLWDQSSTMGDGTPDGSTWWLTAKQGFGEFVNSPQASSLTGAGSPILAVGLQFFPVLRGAPSDCLDDYTTPERDISLLPEAATVLTSIFDARSPSGARPTVLALAGAINHMKARANAHPDRAAVVSLVTNGAPTECDPEDLATLALTASAGFDTEPRVRTYVTALNLGSAAQDFAKIASAGGGTLVAVDGGNVAIGVREALLAPLSMAAAGVSCAYAIPAGPQGTALGAEQMNLELVDSSTGKTTTLPYVDGAASCAGDGWYADDPAAPTKLRLCTDSCRKMATGSLRVVVGCALPVQTPD